MKKNKYNKEKGITLIALVITIIVLLILAGITIGILTSDGSVVGQAENARKSTEESKIKEVLKISYSTCVGNDEEFIVEEQELQDEINKTYPNAEVSKDVNKFIVVINKKYYEIEDNGNDIEGPITFKKIDKNPGDIKTDKDGNPLNGTTKPYEIWNIEDLVEFSRLVSITEGVNGISDKPFSGKKVYLMRDLDFNSILSYENYKAKYRYNEETKAYEPDENATTTIKELCTTGMGFIPIGELYDAYKKCFWGSFDGQGYTISNIYINTERKAGLFGGCGRATITNLTIGGNITSLSDSAGGILAYGNGCTLNKCYNKAKVIGSNNVGGLVSSGATKITECGNYGEVICREGDGAAAGISVAFVNLDKCFNKGTIINNATWVAAGLCGRATGGTPKLTNCYNEGTVIGKLCNSGGLTSWCKVTIKNCYNSGKVIGGNQVAGLCPNSKVEAYNSTAVNCISSGVLENNKNIDTNASGYLIGGDPVITNCFYLNGIYDPTILSPRTGETMFYKTSANSEDMTSQKVVNALNQYIDDHLNDEDAETNTSEWLRWRVGANGLPELIFDF